MSYPPNAGGQAPSFKTNVNRAKTKRWVEAKSYSYDGDDWGEADEYDEYGGYDEPPPPPKPTGLRQQGQSARSTPQSPYGNQADPNQRSMDNGRQGYGNIGSPQQYGQRSATNPQPRVDTGLARSNSFDRGDEKRAFSAGGFQPGVSSPSSTTRQQPSYPVDQYRGPANIQPSMPFDPKQMRPVQPDIHRPYPEQEHRQNVGQPLQEADHAYDQPNFHGEPSYPDEPRHLSRGSRAQSMTSNTSSIDFHNRRDFTPSTVPQPLYPKGSPSPDSRPSSSHPPRKSSLSQMNQPAFPVIGQGTSISAAPESIATQRQRTSSGADKPLPFVRPADIYKRMQDEKERGRQSQDSSRPSMDAAKSSLEHTEHESHPTLEKKELELSTPGISPTPSHILDQVEAREHGRSLQPNLEPVAERKSEYGMAGGEVEARSSKDYGQFREKPPTQQQGSTPSMAQKTLSPVLPEVARMSSFGDSFLGSSGASGEPSLQDMFSSSHTLPSSIEQEPATHEPSAGLQHQPSSGFRSVVNQAFDITDDQIPPTPTSTTGSGVERSISGGTSVISPIISRGPSAAAPNGNRRSLGTRARTPSLPEENEDINSRPISSSSIGTPKEAPRKPSPSQMMPSEIDEPSPPTFIPGHRRDLSTPSPSNSPARTPMVEVNKQLRQPQEAEVAMSTPTQPAFAPAGTWHDQAMRKDSDTSSIKSLNDPRKRSESPSKNRVRDLAGKFESASSSRRGSDQSLTQRGATGAISPQYADLQAPSRPLAADRMESFRPQLPGGWDSYTSNAPTAGFMSKGVDDKNSSPIAEESVTSQNRTRESEAPGASTLTDRANLTGQKSRIRPVQDDYAGPPSFSRIASHDAVPQSTVVDNGEKNDQEDIRTPQVSSTEHSSGYQRSSDPSIVPKDPGDHSALARTSLSSSSEPTYDDEASGPVYEPTPIDPRVSNDRTELVDGPQLYRALETIPSRSEQATPLPRPPTLSSLNTDSGSQYESDRLRKEIFRSLTPNATNERTTEESDSPYQDGPQSPVNTEVQRHGTGHESMIIPREYDSYWNGSESVTSTRSNSEHYSEAAPAVDQQQPSAPTDATTPTPPTNNILSPRLQRLVSEPRIEAQQPTQLPHRFSWDRSTTSQAPNQDVQLVEKREQPPESELVDSPTIRHSFDQIGLGGRETHEDYTCKDSREQQQIRPEESDQPSEKTYLQDPTESQSLKAEPRDFATSPVIDQRSPNAPSAGQDGRLPPFPPSQNTQYKIPAFREISALKTPVERIQGYNEARELFANQGTGLAQWLAASVSEMPEHADVLSNVGRRPAAVMSHKPSSSRLLSGLRSTGPRSDVSDAAGSGLGYNSYPSGGSSKLATQQVQAKGKDLLHSAGVFSGKANVAAKGLFSKSRNKFRGTGGTDKDSSPSSPGMQPRVQPPTRNDHISTQARPFSYVEQVDEFENQEGLLNSHRDAGVSPSDLDGYEENNSQAPTQYSPADAYSSRSDGLVATTNYADARETQATLQGAPNVEYGDVSEQLNETPTEVAATPTPKASFDPQIAPVGNERSAHQDSQAHVSSLSPSGKHSSLQQHLASQADSIRGAIGHSSRNEPPLLKPLSMPRSRFSQQQVEESSVPIDPEQLRPTSVEPRVDRGSEDSSRSFHTAENSHDRPPLTAAQDDLETPKAEKPAKREQPVEPIQSSTAPTSREGNILPQISYTNPEELSQALSMTATQTALGREPSPENVSDLAQSDLPPSPVSPQHSFIQEPARPQGRKGPIYYGPHHDFGPVTDDHTMDTRTGSFGQHSRGPSLDDHPAFRREAFPPQQQKRTSAELVVQGPAQDETVLPHQQNPEPDIGNITISTVRPDGSTTNAKRHSRNSGFFKAFKSPVANTSRINGENDQLYTTPTGSSTEGSKRPKRNSLFGSRNGDKTNGSGQSEESSPAPTSQGDRMPQHVPAASNPKENDSPLGGASSKFRNKLQRASTSGAKEPESGKKKRFSAIGSLFGSRSRHAQSSSASQPKQSQPVTFYQFGGDPQSREPERQPQHQQKHQRPEHPESRPSFKPSSRQSSSIQPQNIDQPPPEGYYAPGRSESMGPPSSTPAWSQTAQRISQPRQPPVNEPAAYAQDTALRQRATAPAEATRSGNMRTSATFPRTSSNESPSAKSRSSIWSRSKSREVPLSKRHDRSTSGNSWTTSPEEPSRQATYNDPMDQQPQPAFPSRPGVSPAHSNQGRVLTYSQFGDSNIQYPPPAPPSIASSDALHHSLQPSSRRQQPQQNVVTFHQFPQQQTNDDNSPPPPPPPPKDDWHVSRPRQSTVPQASNAQPPPESQHSHHPPTSHTRQPSASYIVETNIPKQPPAYIEQPPPPPPASHSHPGSHSSQPQRQSLPPLQTEVQSRRSGAFSPEKTSAESRKARQRELELGGTPNASAVKSAPVEGVEKPERRDENNDDVIVMSSSSYPGMEWTPDRWEDE